MKVALRTDGPVREWHRRLGERLARDGHALAVVQVPASRLVPPGLHRVLAFERWSYGARSRLFETAAMPVRVDEDACELVIEPRFDGTAGEGAMVAALLARRAPRVEVCEVVSGPTRRLASGLPAVEQPDILAGALDMVLARTIQLVEQAVLAAGREHPPQAVTTPAGSSSGTSPYAFLARTLSGKLARRMVEPRGGRDSWRVALRRDADDPAASAQAWRPGGFALLPDDGLGFQADPFIFTHEGRTCVFFEEFPYATRKGVIAMVELDAAGRSSPPRRVLEHEAHLSYPFVFLHEKIVYMLPEISAARRIQLFRAAPFPDRWVPDRVLVDDVVAADATLVTHAGHWWLFATQSGDGGSSWDALCLFYARDLFGPWAAHPRNPVLIDASAARPAGAMWHEDGTLMRVAQDCRRRYGAGVAICRVDRLDPDGYAQTVLDRLEPAPDLGAKRLHTLNRMGGLEVIDVEIPRRRAFRRRESAVPAAPRAPARD